MAAITIGSGFPHIRSTSVLVQIEGLNVMVDCGALEDRSQVEKKLQQHGVEPSDIDLILITHAHFDHIENIGLFTNATVVIHWRELEFIQRLLSASQNGLEELVRSQYAQILDFYVRAIIRRITEYREMYEYLIKDMGRICQVSEDTRLSDRLVMVKTPGHTLGHMSVGLLAKKSIWIMGDAITSRDGWKKCNPHICADFALYSQTYAEIKERGGIIVPGHDQPFDLSTLQRVRFEDLLIGQGDG